MSTAHVPPNAGGTGGNESTEDEITIRTRLFYPLFGIAVIVGVILDVFILILLNTYVPGRARTPFWIFIIPIAVLVFLVSFVDDVLAKHFPNLVPEELRRQLAVAEAAKAAGATQQQGYLQAPGNPMQAQAAPQYRPHPGTALRSRAAVSPSTGNRLPSRWHRRAPATATRPVSRWLPALRSQAPYGQPQQPAQVPPSGQDGRSQQPQYGRPYRPGPGISSPPVAAGSRGRPVRSATEAQKAPGRRLNRCRWGPLVSRHARIEESQGPQGLLLLHRVRLVQPQVDGPVPGVPRVGNPGRDPGRRRPGWGCRRRSDRRCRETDSGRPPHRGGQRHGGQSPPHRGG